LHELYFLRKEGELRERNLQNLLQRASTLNILINTISIWDTVYLEKTVEYKREKRSKKDFFAA